MPGGTNSTIITKGQKKYSREPPTCPPYKEELYSDAPDLGSLANPPFREELYFDLVSARLPVL